MKQRVSEAYPSQTFKVKLFVKTVKGWNPLTIFEKISVLDVRLCSKHTSEFSCKQNLGYGGFDVPNTHEMSTENPKLLYYQKAVKIA